MVARPSQRNQTAHTCMFIDYLVEALQAPSSAHPGR